jgi:hypothetical protein
LRNRFVRQRWRDCHARSRVLHRKGRLAELSREKIGNATAGWAREPSRRYDLRERVNPRDQGDAVNRTDLQKLARVRLGDAKVLLKAKRWPAAYYLAGYAVECGLKACVLVRLAGQPDMIFDDRRFSDKCWTQISSA